MGYFLPYQERWIRDDAPLKLYEKSRRVGITYATSYRCVCKCLRERPGSTFVQWVSSRDAQTAREFVTEYVAMWAREANRVARSLANGFEGVRGLDGRNTEVVDERSGIAAFVVEFRNGARIVSLSSNPFAFAGKGGDVLLDEMDLHEDQGTLYAMAYPCTTWGGQLEIVSAYSADGSDQTEFARLCRLAKGENPMGFSFHRTTLADAISEGFVEKVNSIKRLRGRPEQSREEFLRTLRAGCLTRSSYESQYCCVPNRGGGERLLDPALLDAALRKLPFCRLSFTGEESGGLPAAAGRAEYWRDRFPEGKRYAIGYDIARRGDLSSVWINRKDDGCYVPVGVLTFSNCRFELQRRVVESLFDALPLAVGCGDSTGLGMPVCEGLSERYPDRFEGVNFGASKIALGLLLRSVFERGSQLLPDSCPEVAADLAGLRRGVTESGRLTFTEEGNPLLPASHWDRGWSAALSLRAGEMLDGAGECGMIPARAEPVSVTVSRDFFTSDRTRRSDYALSKSDWP